MTVRRMELDEEIADLVKWRDWADSEAFYYRRRGTEAHDRQHAIELEQCVSELDEIIANLRMSRKGNGDE